MAKIYKISGYVIDVNDEWNENELRWLLENDVIIKHFKAKDADIGEWYDENPLNYINCPIEECEKYFKE